MQLVRRKKKNAGSVARDKILYKGSLYSEITITEANQKRSYIALSKILQVLTLIVSLPVDNFIIHIQIKSFQLVAITQFELSYPLVQVHYSIIIANDIVV